MKIKSDFVSNSSSVSFVIDVTKVSIEPLIQLVEKLKSGELKACFDEFYPTITLSTYTDMIDDDGDVAKELEKFPRDFKKQDEIIIRRSEKELLEQFGIPSEAVTIEMP